MSGSFSSQEPWRWESYRNRSEAFDKLIFQVPAGCPPVLSSKTQTSKEAARYIARPLLNGGQYLRDAKESHDPRITYRGCP